MPFESGWIYHLEFGWVYVVEGDIQGLWLWIDGEGWIWTNEKFGPTCGQIRRGIGCILRTSIPIIIFSIISDQRLRKNCQMIS